MISKKHSQTKALTAGISILVLAFYFINIFTQNTIEYEYSKIIIISIYMGLLLNAFLIFKNIFHPYIIYLNLIFIFNLSSLIINPAFSGDIWIYESNSSLIEINNYVIIEALYSIALFLCFLHLGFIFGVSSKMGEIQHNEINCRDVSHIGKIAGILFMINLPFAYYYYYIWSVDVISLGGYLKITDGAQQIGTENLPLLFRLSDNLMVIFFWMFISNNIDFKKAIVFSSLYLVPFIYISIVGGSRVHVAGQFLTVLIYFSFVYRAKIKNLFKSLILMIAIILIAGVLRSQSDYNIELAYELIKSNDEFILLTLFNELGQTLNVATLTILSIDQNLFDHSFKFLINGLFEDKGCMQGKAENEYNFLADRLSYYYIDRFCYGAGMGSSIIGEFYAAAGIVGIILFSSIYGYFFGLFTSSINSSFLRGLYFIILPGVLYSVRSHPLYLVDFINVALYVSIYSIVKYTNNSKKI